MIRIVRNAGICNDKNHIVDKYISWFRPPYDGRLLPQIIHIVSSSYTDFGMQISVSLNAGVYTPLSDPQAVES